MSSSFLLQIFYKDVQVKGVVVQYWRFGTKCHQCNCIARAAAKKSERETHIFATITSPRYVHPMCKIHIRETKEEEFEVQDVLNKIYF